MELIRPIIVRCNKCNEIIEVDTDLDAIDSKERQMGAEVLYTSEIEDECPKCGNAINIELKVWEYPAGAVEYQEELCVGVEFLEEPEYDPFFDDPYEIG
ncbi:hypothetical protein I260019D6_12830 [Dorea longicatena]|uniref:hypothetical protein n=1 Tax=Dorea longicatena TaxID=88431 RepID=UPI0036F2CF41